MGTWRGDMLRHLLGLSWNCSVPVLVVFRSLYVYVHLAEFSCSLVALVFVRYIFNSLTMYEKKYFSEKLTSFFVLYESNLDVLLTSTVAHLQGRSQPEN